jgi:hypothetical protein
MKTYRILEKIIAEGTENQTSLFYPQYMDSHTLDQNVAVTWYNIVYACTDGEGTVTCTTKEAAIEFVQKKKIEDIPPRFVVHKID